jgi:protein O-mannosyl-transferase
LRALRAALGPVLLVLATVVAYGPALPGDVLWDDDQYVSANPLLTAPDGLWRIWTHPRESPQYYPLVFTTFWLEARWWGLSTFGLHLVNVLLHAANALLLWRLLRRLGVPGAWLAGAVFALHPVHVESVAWITERKNVLSGLFYLLAAAAYVRWLTASHPAWRAAAPGAVSGEPVPGDGAAGAHSGAGWYALALTCFAAALLSKTVTCTLPAVLLLVQVWKQPRVGRRDLLALAPFFALGLAAGLATVLIEKHSVGAMGEEWTLSWVQRGLLANRVLWFYVGKLLWPSHLAFNYERWVMDTSAWQTYAATVVTAAAGLMLWRWRRRFGKGPLVALAAFVVGVGPVLGFFNVYYFRYSYVADHFQYHASMALLALVGAGLTMLAARLTNPATRGEERSVRVLAVLPLVCGVLTYRQAGLYTDIETLWRRTIRQNPASVLARHNLALLLAKGHEDDPRAAAEAETLFREVLEINPRTVDAYVNLGTLASRRGQHTEAIAHYRAALSLDPACATALYSLGRELERTGDVDGAIQAYEKCLAGDASCVPAHNSLGRIYRERGEQPRARAHFEAAVQADPGNAPALRNLGILCEDEQRYDAAIGYYRAALQAEPHMPESWFRIGVCLRAKGDRVGAEAAYQQTLALDPTYVDALIDLAGMAYEDGRLREAAGLYRRALDLGPHDVPLRVNLGATQVALGQYVEAAAGLEEGLRLQPNNVTLEHELAKVLATAPEGQGRDATRAVQLAADVVGRLDPPRPEAYRTLGLAYAAVGQYRQAAEAAERALELTGPRGRQDLDAALRNDLERYKKGVSEPRSSP